MGSLFRSEQICLARLYLQSEAAFATVDKLGELGLVQFVDLNSEENSFQRTYVEDVRRCEEMERRLNFLNGEMKKENIEMVDNGGTPDTPNKREQLELEEKFSKYESDLKNLNDHHNTLKKQFLELTEMKQILKRAQDFFQEMDNIETNNGDDELLIEGGQGGGLQLGFVAGVILRSKVHSFEKVLWRACRGNVFLKHAEIDQTLEDPATNAQVNKVVFIAFFQGEQLRSRVKKICEGFHCNTYEEIGLLNTADLKVVEVQQRSIQEQLHQATLVLNQSEDHRQLLLSQVSVNIREWFVKVRKVKAIFHSMNLLNNDVGKNCLIAEVWCPTADIPLVQQALQYGSEVSGSKVQAILEEVRTSEKPPTFNRNNSFTSSFQAIIDAFGVANYQEVNPAPFTIITFPFLFGVMFGDIGHGFLMFLFGLMFVIKEKQYLAKKDMGEIVGMAFGGRYMILLMGLFSLYVGLLYNECFSRSFNIFGTAWNASAMGYTENFLGNVSEAQLDPVVPGVFRGFPDQYYNQSGSPYVFGMDPIWQSAENKIVFQNSYKMKSAIILGFCQMFFGLILALFNHLYFKDYLKIFCEWIPQMIFLLCIVGYLCAIIIYKWLVWQEPSSAPSLLIGLINMFMLTQPSVEDHTLLYSHQGAVQNIVVVLAVICIPWMLLAHPTVEYVHRRKKNRRYTLLKQTGVENPGYKKPDDASSITKVQVEIPKLLNKEYGMLEGEDNQPIIDEDQLARSSSESTDISAHQQENQEKEFSEIMILQIIHTIEYSLSCISHTASYLRLWALSLAHSELSEVLWNMVLHIGLTMKGFTGSIGLFLVFIFFATLTVSILLAMEGLSAFLHALRLHWVEFQNKFYGGEGIPFEPFSFKNAVVADE